MRLFKKSKKPRQPSKQPMSPVIPTQIAVGALGMSTDLNVGSGDENSTGSSRIVLRDRSEVQRPRASGVSTSVREQLEGEITSLHELSERKAPSDALMEQIGHIAPDFSTSGMEPGVRDRVVQGTEPSEAPVERMSESDLVSEDTHGTAQSGRSGGVEGDSNGGAIPTVVLADNEGAGGFGTLRAKLKAVHTNYKDIAAIGKKAEDLHSRVVALEVRFDSLPGDVEEMRRRGKAIMLTEIQERLGLLFERSGPQPPGHFSEPLEDLREAIFHYQMTRQLAIYEQTLSLINLDEATVLNNFHCARGAEYRHGERKGCLKGTREAVLDEITFWTRDFSQLPVYWLNGMAGTGKSTIAQTVAERAFADGYLGASFFCSRYFEDRSNLRSIFPTLAVQLARKYPEFRSVFIPLVQSDPDIAHKSLYNQMDKLIVRPLMKSGISTIIMVDGLDECKDKEPTSAILSVLGQFVSKLLKVKFFITGCPEPHIQDSFCLPLLVEMTDLFVLHEGKSDQVDSDIQLFFKNFFSELTHHQSGLDDWPTQTQLDLLCQQAAGFFVYAVATIKFIGSHNSNPKTQLDLLLQQPKTTIYEGMARCNVNNNLDSLYMLILQEAFNDISPEDPLKVHSVLGAAILVVNPLSPSSIATLLGFSVQDVTLLLSSVHPLILHEGINQLVQPFHKSFPDFITNSLQCSDQRFHIPPHNHLQLLVSCIKLMNQTLEKNMCHLPEAVKNSEVDDLKERTEQYINHALQYACKSWYKHLVNEPSANRHEITSALHCFLEKNFLCWLEVLSVLGATKNAVNALKVAVKWLEESPTLNLVNDCLQFVTVFFEVISTSAPHIYHSALLLCPKESIVQKIYGLQAKPMTRVIQGVPTSWDPIIATTRFPELVYASVWSPCSRLFVVALFKPPQVVVLDAITFERLYTMDAPQDDTEWDNISFSPGSHLLTAYSWGKSCYIISWDIQTGVPLSHIIMPEDSRCYSVSHSVCETMIGALFWGSFGSGSIRIYSILSGMCISSYPIQKSIHGTIWTHGQYLQFAIVELESITVQQVSFTSTQPPTKVGSLPIPDNFSQKELVLLPTLSRLAFILNGNVLVWDAQNQKLLLDSADVDHPRAMSFSHDGQFFACGSDGIEFHIWKESPTGYQSHQKLVSGIVQTTPLVSPNEDLVISSSASTLQLWHTTSSPASTSSISLQAFQHDGWFFVEFSPDQSVVAVTEWQGCIITVFAMEFSHPWLVIDTETKTHGLRVTDDQIVVVGDEKIITWELPARDCAFNTRRGINNNIKTTTLQHSALDGATASISPDLKYVAFGGIKEHLAGFFIHNMDTGEKLAFAASNRTFLGFSPSGQEIWSVTEDGEVDKWKIVEDGSNVIWLQQLEKGTRPLSGFPWHSLSGYQITDDGWIICSSRKHLLWLPHNWHPDSMIQRRWSGKLLAIWNQDSPKPYILKLEV